MTSADPRPRIVDAAFWSWLVAGAVLAFLGILGAVSNAPVFFRGVGVILGIAGLAIGYLAGRTRRGDKRFRRATVALAFALAVLLIVFAMLSGGLIWLLPMVLLWTGAFTVTRPPANEWFDAVDSEEDNG
jgi:predicted MFS family arabinose efflux permease